MAPVSMAATGGGPRPLLLVVDSDPIVLDRLEAELQRSFGSNYRVRGELTAAEALGVLDRAAGIGQRLAVVLVDQALDAEERSEVLDRARTLHPDARRALLVEWGAWADRDIAQSILTAMAVGEIGYYVLKPWTDCDELFHRTVAEFVQEWSRADVSNFREVVVIAARRSARGHAVRNLLTRNGIPSAFRELGSELADAALRDVAATGADVTGAEVVVWMPVIEQRVLC
ncbi:MAG TPA: hypothetical protein VLA97_14445, partial [Nocardioidaceae bacterium]|nr:hypothetical protein [Nocardioidaceae bacterium]